MAQPKGLGYNVEREHMNRIAGEQFQGEVLGTIKEEITDPEPQGPSAAWGEMALKEPPPPWELEDVDYTPSDARRYVDAPANITLRWVNPKFIESDGWRHWQPLTHANPKVKLKVESMKCPDGTIRRGGSQGDILAWMYTTWVESRRRQLREETDRQTQSAVEKQQSLRDEFKRGSFGPYVHLDEAKHPTHTMVEGRSLEL